ncbi:MAG: hypothetical protein WBF43_04385 [Methylocella sp.]
MRLINFVAVGLMPIVVNAAQTNTQASSDRQAYCVNRSADFYPYSGKPCSSGFQLGPGNCRRTDGRIIAVSKKQCIEISGTIEIPFEGGRPKNRSQAPKSIK